MRTGFYHLVAAGLAVQATAVAAGEDTSSIEQRLSQIANGEIAVSPEDL